MQKFADNYNTTLDKLIHRRVARGKEDNSLVDGIYFPFKLAIFVANDCSKIIGEKLLAYVMNLYPGYEFDFNPTEELEDAENNNNSEENSKEIEGEQNNGEINIMENIKDEDISPVNNANNLVRKDSILQLENVEIICRSSDNYINLTNLCQAGKKAFYRWNRNEKTEAFLKALSTSIQKSIDEIIAYEDHGPFNRQTWGHPQVAINIAQWISPEFSVKVSKWIFELMTFGKVELGQERSQNIIEAEYKEKMEEQLWALQLDNKKSEELIENSFMSTEQERIDTMIDTFQSFFNVDQFNTVQINYCGYVGVIEGKHTFKFGQSDGKVTDRKDDHIREFGQFTFLWIKPASKTTEQQFKSFLKSKGILIKVNTKTKIQTELFYTTENFTIKHIRGEFDRLLRTDSLDLKIENINLKHEIELLNGQIREMKLQHQIDLLKLHR